MISFLGINMETPKSKEDDHNFLGGKDIDGSYKNVAGMGMNPTADLVV